MELCRGLGLVGMMLLVGACEINRTPRPQVLNPDSASRADIRAAMDAYQQALLAGDARRAAAFFAPDSRISRPDARDISGASEVNQVLREFFAGSQLTSIELDRYALDMVRGGAAWEAGRFAASVRPEDGPEQSVRGGYMIRWRQGPETRWRIDTFMFNRYPPDSAAADDTAGAPDADA